MAHDYLITSEEESLFGVPADVVEQVPADVRDRKRQAATDEMLGYLHTFGGAVLPLTAWGDITRQKTADLFVYELKSWLGLAPQQAATGDENIILRAQLARDWAKSSTLQDQDIVDSSATADTGTVDVESDNARGW